MARLGRLVLVEKGDRQGEVWNVFVQVFTHLIGVLLFVAVISVIKYEDQSRRYGKAAEKDREEKEWCQRQFEQADNANECLKKTKELWSSNMNLQRAELLKAFSQVKELLLTEKELYLLLHADGVIKSKQAENEQTIDYKDLCSFIAPAQAYFSENASANDLYQRILKEAKVTDDSDEVREDWENKDAEISNAYQREFEREPGKIVRPNRAFIQMELRGWLADEAKRVNSIERRVILRRVKEIEDDKAAWGDQSQVSSQTGDAARIFYDPNVSHAQKVELAVKESRAAAESVQASLTEKGCRLSPKVWSEVFGVAN